MKPPVVHQPVQPPLPLDSVPEPTGPDAVRPREATGADDGRDVRESSTEGRTPGLVGDYGPLVETRAPHVDVDDLPEVERRRH